MLHSFRRSQFTFPQLRRHTDEHTSRSGGLDSSALYVLHVQSVDWNSPGGPRKSAFWAEVGPPSPSGRGVWQRLHSLRRAKFTFEQLQTSRLSVTALSRVDGPRRSRISATRTLDWGTASRPPTAGICPRRRVLRRLLHLDRPLSVPKRMEIWGSDSKSDSHIHSIH